MQVNEADKIIAEYMEVEYEIRDKIFMTPTADRWWMPMELYSSSLDALVPVWEKLGHEATQGIGFHRYKSGWQVGLGSILPIAHISTERTIQAAACITTAKCIQALNNQQPTTS